jgi:hypothetical protein
VLPPPIQLVTCPAPVKCPPGTKVNAWRNNKVGRASIADRSIRSPSLWLKPVIWSDHPRRHA